MRKWRRRIIALAVVAITATLAWAAPNPVTDFTVDPRILGLRHQLGTKVTGPVMLSSAGAFNGRIKYTCDSDIRMEGGSGDDPLTIPSGTITKQLECPTTLGTGIHSCLFSVENGSGAQVAQFRGFCETFTQQALNAAPAPTFTNQTIGVDSQPFSVTINNPTQTLISALQVHVDNDNFLVASPCQNQVFCNAGSVLAGSSSNIQVICRPQTAGPHTGQLFMSGSNGFSIGPPLLMTCMTGSGSGSGAVLTLSPPDVNVGSVEVNNATGQASLALTNGGAAGALTIDGISIVDNGVVGAGSDWTFTLDGKCTGLSCMLGPSEALNVRLTFDPSGFNARPARLVVNYTDSVGAKQASANLGGAGIGATLELVTTNGLDFGVVPVGVAANPQSITLQNRGNRATIANLAATPMIPFQFQASVTVQPGQMTVPIGCMANTVVDNSTTLTINGSDAPSTQSLPIHCEVRDTSIVADPTAIPLGEIRIGDSIAPRVVTVRRTDNLPTPAIPLSGAGLDPMTANLSLGALSQPMTPATTTLTVTPTTEGAVDSDIVITPMSGSGITIPVTGNVVRAELTATDVMTLGTFCVGQPTTPTSVNLTSTGTATVTVTDVALGGGTDSPFTLEKTTPSTYPASLAPQGGQATVLITPKRAETPDDAVADTLVWSTDAGTVTSTLTTMFVADGGAVAPGELEFGEVPIRVAVNNGQGVTLQNCSTAPLQLIEPTVPPPFELAGQFPLLLEPAARATFTIVFHPTETGVFEKHLTIESMGGDMFDVALRGTGVAGDDGGGSGSGSGGALDETSFYACGCRGSDPAGVLVIAVAAMCVLLPRRRRREPA